MIQCNRQITQSSTPLALTINKDHLETIDRKDVVAFIDGQGSLHREDSREDTWKNSTRSLYAKD